jgi:hypothetical protein
MFEKIISEVSQILHEIYFAPLAMPIVLALMWRSYVKEIHFYIIPGALVIAGAATYLFPNSRPIFLDLQKGAVESFLHSLDSAPLVLALVQSWDIESKIVSQQAAVFAFTLYSVLILPIEGRRWYQYAGMFLLMLSMVAALTLGCWFLLLSYGLPKSFPKVEEYAAMTMGHRHDVLRRGIEHLVSLPIAAAGYGMSIWVLLCFAVTFPGKHPIRWAQLATHPLMEKFMPVIISIVILAFALSGFLFLQAFQATLWLLFWVTAYPVALSFTRGAPLGGEKLVDIYKAGLTQVPFIGQLFATFIGSPPATPKGNATRPKSTKRSRDQNRVDTPPEKESRI